MSAILSRDKISEFRGILLESIEEGLGILGESVKQTVYYYMERNNSLRKRDIPLKLDEFSLALRTIFGSVGARFIENQILRNLYSKIGSRYTERGGLNFKQHVRLAMKIYKAR